SRRTWSVWTPPTSIPCSQEPATPSAKNAPGDVGGFYEAASSGLACMRQAVGFKGEVERHLTGKETEPWEIIYFKLYRSQLLVVEKAIETAGLMLGTDRSRGYYLEMICAD